MGTKNTRSKNNVLFYKNYNSYRVNNNNICINCPSRIFHLDEIINFGIGNINSGKLFILPTFNNINKIINVLSKEYTEITGLDLLENVYITALVKCIPDKDYNTYKQSIQYCNKFLKHEINRVKFRSIIYLYTDIRYYIDDCIYPQIQIILNYNNTRQYNNFRTLFANAINSFI